MKRDLSKSPTLEEDTGPEVWLSGYETIHLVSELLESKEEPNRRTGKSAKLAIAHVHLALKHPHQRIVIKDHFNNNTAHENLQRNICKILDVLGIDYEIGVRRAYIRDPDSFTNVAPALADDYYIIAKPKPGITVT